MLVANWQIERLVARLSQWVPVTETTGTGVPIVLLSELDPDVRLALRPRSPPDRRSSPCLWFLDRGRLRPHTRPANRSCRTSSAWRSPCPGSLRNRSAAARQLHPKPPPGGRRSLLRLPGPRSDNVPTAIPG